MQNIGLFGGTFNPIHLGHLIIANEVLESLRLDKIIFIPTGVPPHKDIGVVKGKHRFEMVKLAIEDNPYFEVSDIEIKRLDYSYTYDTLKELQKIYYVNKFRFIIGYDAFLEIDSWKNVKEVFKMAQFVVVNRNVESREMLKLIEEKCNKFDGEAIYLKVPNIEISSTEIRKRINEGKSIKYLLPDKVIDYIQKNDLYRGD
ncbi:nicotinate-nucleotide adenylyltransferase [Caloramator sp. CAR-1]|uniref:nicotinate-nucleotide adenylyltransferase n=1 Tax=Caloramator sp. CAR-1 TaxID=3062777 RepID=UPI0026E143F8|nr:nicotinate-nucleotide adenylyltransferase [Caloramator sp. CAR-1]MDO6355354.1 nicotinate-nucleotide adenylyltransferase [Caloramator sp. CAR-1]